MGDITGLKQSILAQSHDKGRRDLAVAKKNLATAFEQDKAQLLLEKKSCRNSRLDDIRRRFQRERQQLENQARQSSLRTKQTVLRELFAEAESQMVNWSEEEHLSFFRSVMDSYQETVTVRFGQLTAGTFSENTWSTLASSYPKAEFDRSPIPQEAGFIISQDKVDDNFLYSSLMADFLETEGFRLVSDIFRID